MKMFIWRRLSRLTRRSHSAGGLTVIASTLHQARALAVRSRMVVHNGHFLSTEPDEVLPLAPGYESDTSVRVFPDAGCCDH